MQQDDRRRSSRDKPVVSYAESPLGKPKMEGTRRSAREKPPVCYSEGVMDAGQDLRKRAAVKVRESSWSDLLRISRLRISRRAFLYHEHFATHASTNPDPRLIFFS